MHLHRLHHPVVRIQPRSQVQLPFTHLLCALPPLLVPLIFPTLHRRTHRCMSTARCVLLAHPVLRALRRLMAPDPPHQLTTLTHRTPLPLTQIMQLPKYTTHVLHLEFLCADLSYKGPNHDPFWLGRRLSVRSETFATAWSGSRNPGQDIVSLACFVFP